MLDKNPRVISIALGGWAPRDEIKPASSFRLGEAISKHTGLRKFTYNDFDSAEQISAFFAGLKENNSLSKLALGSCKIDRNAISPFAEFFEKNTSIEDLDLQDLSIGNEEMPDFVKSLLTRRVPLKVLNFTGLTEDSSKLIPILSKGTLINPR